MSLTSGRIDTGILNNTTRTTLQLLSSNKLVNHADPTRYAVLKKKILLFIILVPLLSEVSLILCV